MLSSRSSFFVLAGLLLLAGCATPTVQTSAPPPAPGPHAPAAPPISAVAADWRDRPLTTGSWHYQPRAGGSAAVYGRAAAPADFIMRCDNASRQVLLLRPGTATALVVTTSAGAERFPAGPVDDQGVAMSGVAFEAGNPFLDRMAFSRGRVMIEAAGLPAIIVPAWAEPERVVEDCRK